MRSRHALGGYLVGAVTARTGDEMSGPALLLAGYAVTGSTALASLLLAGSTVAAAVGGPVLGALLDRTTRPGRLLGHALALYGTGLLLVLAALGRLPLAAVVPLAVAAGLFGPALSGGWTAQLPRVAPGTALVRANALDAMTFGTAALAGPALAGLTAGALGAPAAVVLAAALIAAAAPVAWRLPARTAPRNGPVSPLTADLLAGARQVRRSPSLARATFASVVCCAAQGMFTACVPLFGERAFGGAGQGAFLLVCAAVAALAANAVLARVRIAAGPDALVRAGALVQALALALAAGGHPALLIAAAVLAGIGEGPQLTALFAIRHREAPERLRAQVFTTGASLKLTGFAVGAAVAGTTAGHSLELTLLLASAVALLGAPAYGRATTPGRGADVRPGG
ncbi:MFS transporter [Streptomyces sp. NPDC048290]|uniref:MFS transporter n=1 Tax=Streptomyces sp. NPDC048290 TaxID=3155811 RepID=UPI0034412F94